MYQYNYYTNYPIEKLGDILGKRAPVRKCNILFYDEDKYVDIFIEGVITRIKRGYVCRTKRLTKKCRGITHRSLIKLITV